MDQQIQMILNDIKIQCKLLNRYPSYADEKITEGHKDRQINGMTFVLLTYGIIGEYHELVGKQFVINDIDNNEQWNVIISSCQKVSKIQQKLYALSNGAPKEI